MPPTVACDTAELDALLERISADYAVEFTPLAVGDDTPLWILSIRDMRAHLDALMRRGAMQDPLRRLPLWAKVWPASFILGRLLRRYEPRGKTLLELGAGCGVLGLVAARYGFARVILSDVEEDALRFARANALRNGLAERVEVVRLDVTQAPNVPGDVPGADVPPAFDMIAASELLYLEDLHKPLLTFLERSLAPEGRAFFCTDMAREKPEFAALAAQKFRVSQGHVRMKMHDTDGSEERRVYSVLILERRP